MTSSYSPSFESSSDSSSSSSDIGSPSRSPSFSSDSGFNSSLIDSVVSSIHDTYPGFNSPSIKPYESRASKGVLEAADYCKNNYDSIGSPSSKPFPSRGSPSSLPKLSGPDLDMISNYVNDNFPSIGSPSKFPVGNSPSSKPFPSQGSPSSLPKLSGPDLDMISNYVNDNFPSIGSPSKFPVGNSPSARPKIEAIASNFNSPSKSPLSPYDKLDYHSPYNDNMLPEIFKKENILPKVESLRKSFDIDDSMVRGIHLLNKHEYNGMGAGYDFVKKTIDLSPEPPRHFVSLCKPSKYERLMEENFLPHEYGHVKVIEEYGNPLEHQSSSGLDLDYLTGTHEHAADIVAKSFDTNFGISQRELLEDMYNKDDLINSPMQELNRRLGDKAALDPFAYIKAQSRDFALPEVEEKLDYNLYESLVKKTDFETANRIMDDLNHVTEKMQEVGLSFPSSKPSFLSKLNDIKQTFSRIDRYLNESIEDEIRQPYRKF
ncbi:hypothetical protein KY330_03660 [Candidatus Woesearchaeota archaeon]|nr:hypothetical protein [Candidatus Woesearchaeota archaeon]